MLISREVAEKIIKGLQVISKNNSEDKEAIKNNMNSCFSDISEMEMEKFILWLQNSFDIE